MTVTIKDHVVVDHTIGTKVQINFNISFYALHCGGTHTHTTLAASKLWSMELIVPCCVVHTEVNLDAMDVAGDQQNDIDHDIFKMRLDGNQVIIGDAFRHDMDQDPADPLPADYCGSCYGAGDEGVSLVGHNNNKQQRLTRHCVFDAPCRSAATHVMH